MANDLTNVIPQLLAQGLMALRQNARTALMVNRGYESMAGEQGSTVDVPIPSAIAAQVVTPGATPPSTGDITPSKVSIELDQWIEAPFYMTDNDMMKIQSGFMPRVASEAVKSVVNYVDDYVLALGRKFFSITQPAGSGPFLDGSGNPTHKDAVDLRVALTNQLAPTDERVVVLDPTATGNALMVSSLTDSAFVGDTMALREGRITNRLGFAWLENQNVTQFTSGTASGYLVNSGSLAVGDKAVAVDTGTGTFVDGDIITFAGHSQQYVITAAYAGGAGNIAIEPGLQEAPADNAAITKVTSGTTVSNIAFHRDAIALATRPLAGSVHPGAIISSMTDELSGLTLRLEVTREHKRDRFSFDILFGAEVIRRELGTRLEG